MFTGCLSVLGTYPPPEIGTYQVGNEIQKTGHSVVLEGIDTRSGRKVAIKLMRLTERTEPEIMNEITIQQMLDNDHILKIHDWAPIPEYGLIAIIMERTMYGDLYDYITSYPYPPEEVAAKIAFQIVKAIMHMHNDRSMVHRDIKPENVLIRNIVDGIPDVVLIDFGYSIKITEGEMCTDPKGTPMYCAPEIYLGNPYDFKVDAYAFGTTLYCLLTKRPPVDVSSTQAMRNDIINGRIDYSNDEFCDLSDEAKDLIYSLLAYDPDDRPTFNQIQNHPWFDTFYPDRFKEGFVPHFSDDESDIPQY